MEVLDRFFKESCPLLSPRQSNLSVLKALVL